MELKAKCDRVGNDAARGAGVLAHRCGGHAGAVVQSVDVHGSIVGGIASRACGLCRTVNGKWSKDEDGGGVSSDGCERVAGMEDREHDVFFFKQKTAYEI